MYKSLVEAFSDGRRWLQNASIRYMNIDGKGMPCYCLTGALLEIYSSINDRAVARAKLAAAINNYELKNSEQYVDIIGWNDSSVRTVTDIQRVVALANI